DLNHELTRIDTNQRMNDGMTREHGSSCKVGAGHRTAWRLNVNRAEGSARQKVKLRGEQRATWERSEVQSPLPQSIERGKRKKPSGAGTARGSRVQKVGLRRRCGCATVELLKV